MLGGQNAFAESAAQWQAVGMKVTLREGPYGSFILQGEPEDELLIQQDWDIPPTASLFGWTPCACGRTDGTIDCNHRSVTEMISDARSFLEACVGQSTDLFR
jgi:hypothetical protein